MNPVTTIILDEGKWLPFSIGLALLGVAILLVKHRQLRTTPRQRTLAAMSLYFGGMVGTMAFGHLLAVSIKIGLGLIEGPALSLYAIGLSLAGPAWWLCFHASSRMVSDQHARWTVALNVWLTATLLVLGLHNLPLAAPGLLAIWYQKHSNRSLGWVIVSLFVFASLGLFIASLVFLASGQTFEQFRGL